MPDQVERWTIQVGPRVFGGAGSAKGPEADSVEVVRYSDYEKLKAEIERLNVELRAASEGRRVKNPMGVEERRNLEEALHRMTGLRDLEKSRADEARKQRDEELRERLEKLPILKKSFGPKWDPGIQVVLKRQDVLSIFEEADK
jgi:hypothetical protein